MIDPARMPPFWATMSFSCCVEHGMFLAVGEKEEEAKRAKLAYSAK